VYGDPFEHPQKESYWGNVNSYGERSCYDEAKRYAEALIYYYRRDFGVNTGIVRIFNTYGPKMKSDDGRVISNFICQAISGKDLTIFGDGSQTRSFCYIDDQVDAQIKMIHSKLEGPINAGSPEEFTIYELAKKVLRLTGSKSRLIRSKLPKDDPAQRRPDISRAKTLLNWAPKIKLEKGLKKTITWFQNNP
jgi:UDP-glucuronate decarboxylase